MDIVNPLTGNLAQSGSVVQRQQSVTKAQQIRREQALRKDVTASGDHFDHQVESCEELNPIHDEPKDGHRDQPPPDAEASAEESNDEKPHIDVTV